MPGNNDQNPRHLIFGQGDPVNNYKKLSPSKSGPNWLIRESRQDGMISIDFIDPNTNKGDSRRFAWFPEENTWKTIGGSEIDKWTTSMRGIHLDSADFSDKILLLLKIISEKFPHLSMDNMLFPSAHEQTRSDLYESALSLAEDAKRDATSNVGNEAVYKLLEKLGDCPISFTPIKDIRHPVWLNNQIYEKEALMKWVKANHNDPLSRAAVSESDIRDATIVGKLKALANPKPELRAYLDFDGTLTGLDGETTINSPFYRSLLKNPKSNYATAEFKENLVDLVREGLKDKKNSSMRMLEDAASFLNQVISTNGEICIISRNRREYIEAVLRVSFENIGLNNNQINTIIQKIKIWDINDVNKANGKGAIVAEEERISGTAKTTIMLDDNSNDLLRMCARMDQDVSTAAQCNTNYANGKQATNGTFLIAEHKKAGEYNFSRWIQQPPVAEEKQEVPSLADLKLDKYIETYKERPGKVYLNFSDDKEEMNKTIDLFHKMGYRQGHGKSFADDEDYRKSSQKNTLEISPEMAREINLPALYNLNLHQYVTTYPDQPGGVYLKFSNADEMKRTMDVLMSMGYLKAEGKTLDDKDFRSIGKRNILEISPAIRDIIEKLSVSDELSSHPRPHQ